MFIILEGCDGAGKSTLSDAIVKEIEYRFPGQDIETVHSSQLKNDPIDEYALEYEAYVPGNGQHFVVDRLHWGETIYGPLYRKKSALSKGAFRWVEMYLKARGATTWHVSAALETVENRLRVRGEDYLQTHDVEHVWSSFNEVAKTALTCGGTAMTDQADPETLAKIIVDEAIYNEITARDAFRPEYIGRALPSALLVGDKQGNSDPGATKAPFMPRGQSCGDFFMASLPELWWHQVGIVNVYETDVLDLLDKLYYPYVVAMGAFATKELHRLGVEHAVVPHPQKIRRFHNPRGSEYGALIRLTHTTQEKHLSWPN